MSPDEIFSGGDLVARIVDHITETKTMMGEAGGPFESIVPLVSVEKQIPPEELSRLYTIIEKQREPFNQDEYPYFNKKPSGQISEGTQQDRIYRTKIPGVNVVESWDKDSNQLLSAHIVIGRE